MPSLSPSRSTSWPRIRLSWEFPTPRIMQPGRTLVYTPYASIRRLGMWAKQTSATSAGAYLRANTEWSA